MARQVAAVALHLGLTAYQAEAACPLLQPRILDCRRYHLYPDTLSVLEWTAAHRYRNILVSNNYPELPEMMVRLGLASYFQEMLVSARLGYEKPHPVIFQRMLAAAGRPAQSGNLRDNRGQSLCRYRGRETGRYENRPGAPGRWRSSGRRHHRRFSGPPRLSQDMGERITAAGN